MKNSKIFITDLMIIPLVLLGAGCTDDLPEGERIDYEEDVLLLIEENNSKHAVRGSCNLIAQASHCEDYIGSLWTQEQMQLNCQGAGTFSLDVCPYSDNGGCMSGEGTIAENVVWSYPYGGVPITGEDLYYESQACDILEIARWVTPADLLE